MLVCVLKDKMIDVAICSDNSCSKDILIRKIGYDIASCTTKPITATVGLDAFLSFSSSVDI